MGGDEDAEAVSMSHDKVNLRKDKMKLTSVASEKELQRRLGMESATAAAEVAEQTDYLNQNMQRKMN